MEHYVKGARGSKWQNPFTVKRYGLEKCLQLYEETRPERSIAPRNRELIINRQRPEWLSYISWVTLVELN